MQDTSLFELDHEYLKQSNQNTEVYLQQYHFIVESLKKELSACKAEQTKLRNELETIREETTASTKSAHDYFSQMQNEKCPIHSETENALVANLEKRLTVMQMEKESIFQLWQMSLKAIDVLEEELKSTQQGHVERTFYEDQVSTIKASYSNAIKELESKLVQSKEHFLMHQDLFESSKTKLQQLAKERDQLEQRAKDFEEALAKREKIHNDAISELTEKLRTRERELEAAKESKAELKAKLTETQKHLGNFVAKENEAKAKVSEALELVESAIREKEEAVRREARALEEATQLRAKFGSVSLEYAKKLEAEVAKIREFYEGNVKRYESEVEELKVEVQQKATLNDRVIREYRLAQEEMEKVQQQSEGFHRKSEARVGELERRLQEAEVKLQTCEETWKLRYSEKCRVLEQYDQLLRDRLQEGEKGGRRDGRGSNEVEELVKEMNERTKEAVQKYSSIERSLSRSFGDREKMDMEVRGLQMAFEKEAERRDRERRLLEVKIRGLEDELRIANSLIGEGREFGERSRVAKSQSRSHCGNEGNGSSDFTNRATQLQLKQLQESTEARIKELTSHVETHQNLSKRWKEEVQTLTVKFRKHSKEMKSKIYILRQENEELNKELTLCRQKLAQFSTQIYR